MESEISSKYSFVLYPSTLHMNQPFSEVWFDEFGIMDIIKSIFGNVQNLSGEIAAMNDSFVGVVVPLTAVPATVSESSDEGIGSMSPEPVAIITNTSVISGLDNGDPSREMIELRVQLDRERRLRMHLEDQVWYFG
jgi:hypothetical protein